MSTHDIHTDRIGEQAGIVLFSQWNEFCRLRKAVLKHHDTDTIHDLRVASRRMRATLGLFAPLLSVKSVKILLKGIRRVTRELGHVRNIDEAILYFDTLSADLPTLRKGLRRARKMEIASVIKVLKQFPCQDMTRLLKKTVAELGGRSSQDRVERTLPAYLSDTSIQRYQALYDLLAPAIIPENVEGRHGLRIAIKKWRYLLETIGQVCNQEYAVTLDVLKEYQIVLGNLNDMVEFAALSATLRLPKEEKKAIKMALAGDTARHLACFIKIAAQKPLQYTFHL